MSFFYTFSGEFESETTIEKSKFICYVKGVENESQAKEFISSIKKKNSLATHNCYAYISDDKGLEMKFSDDGEPQGTAGLPMLEVLKTKRIYKSVAVVTRYFGGIKLGTGGLTRAYSGAVNSCINVANVVKMQYASCYEIFSSYEDYPKLQKIFNNNNISLLDTFFDAEIKIKFAIKEEFCKEFLNVLNDVFKGKQRLSFIDKNYFSFGEKCR